ncbi:MAG: transposase [Sorangiineae bacterium]|nr:transposase [Polyangiaceae bacterium]MEB2320975.1 transposase [Sorangiineae bacterium]
MLTLPFELGARLTFDGELLGEVCRAFVDSVMGWYRRHVAALDIPGGKSGTVTAVQRTSSDLRTNPHFRTLALDGVFVEAHDGERAFRCLPALSNTDVADILQLARTRTLRLLRRKRVSEDDEVTADLALAGREPALAGLVGSGVTGTPPAGPAPRRQDPIELRAGREPEVRGPCAAEHGWSLHAAPTAAADDRAGKEILCKDVVRPPITQDGGQLVAGELVRRTQRRPFSGTSPSTWPRSRSWSTWPWSCRRDASTATGTPASSP